MVIELRAVIRFAAGLGGLEFIGERARPFLPGKVPLFREFDRQRERLRLPWFCKHGAFLIEGQER